MDGQTDVRTDGRTDKRTDDRDGTNTRRSVRVIAYMQARQDRPIDHTARDSVALSNKPNKVGRKSTKSGTGQN